MRIYDLAWLCQFKLYNNIYIYLCVYIVYVEDGLLYIMKWDWSKEFVLNLREYCMIRKLIRCNTYFSDILMEYRIMWWLVHRFAYILLLKIEVILVRALKVYGIRFWIYESCI